MKRGFVPKPGRMVLYLVLLLVFIVYVAPVDWIINTSFRADIDTLAYPPKLFSQPTVINYVNSFGKSNLTVNFRNSVTISLASSFLALLIGAPCAYALSRFKFKGNQLIYFSFMAIRVAPIILSVMPVFLVSRQIGVFDTVGLLVVMNTMNNVTWVVWMMRTFFDDISREIDEAAMVDGCNRVSCLTRIILPLASPGLAATLIFCLITTWNEYFMALVLTNVNARTLPMALNSFISVYGLRWGEMCAASTVIMMPVFLFVLFLQKYLVKGLTVGAVKG